MTENHRQRMRSLLATLVVVVASVALAGFPVGHPGDAPSAAWNEAPTAADPPSPADGREAPLTREALRQWVAKQDLPTARLAFEGGRGVPFADFAPGRGVATPTDANEVALHKADLAHTEGFEGDGVRVAVIDTGVDFAHPDLANATARVEDPASDYFLHPIAYDGASMNDYLTFGEPGPGSWYVNTSYVSEVGVFPDGTGVVNWTDGTTSLSWSVTGEPGFTAGEEVRIGFHPDDKLLEIYRERPGLVLYNDAGEGPPFDTIRVDLDNDLSFVGEKPAYINTDWGSFDADAELIHRDLDEDGVQDVSGGMLYFVADGVRQIPYASRQIEALNFTFQTLRNDNSFDVWADVGVDPSQHLVPEVGDLVLLFGDFGGPGAAGAHGTWVTSALVGQGVTGGGSVGPVLQGMAPGAKVIGSGNNFGTADPFGQMGLWTALIFATEGYDGTVNTGDEAHLASNSWGSSEWTGWSWGSRFADYVSTVWADERTLFVFAAGNSGPGYGGRGGPAGGPGLLVAGAMENYLYRVDPWFAFEGGPNPAHGDTASFSTRGPSALGRHYVDSLTSGEFGYGAEPLNNNPFCDPSEGAPCSPAAFNGSASWVLWSGTSLATPNLAGVTTLVYDAYMDAHGGPPLAGTAKTIVKNGADDAHQDPFLTGAGIANAHRGVRIANEKDGLTTSLHEWYPGDYRGATHPGYARLLPPGGSDSVALTLENHRPSASMDVTISDGVLTKTGTLALSFSRAPGSAPNQRLLNESGLLADDGTVLVADPGNLFARADAVRVTLFFDRDRMAEVPYYLLRVFDWTDGDADGAFDGFEEQNLMVQDWISFDIIHGPNGFVQVFDPANRSHDGLVLHLQPVFEGFLTSSATVTLQVDYFERRDTPWLAASVGSITVPPVDQESVTLQVDVPGDADPGLYEAVVLFTLDDGNVTTLPVVVNVVASLPGTLGGNALDSGPYQQGVQYGSVWEFFYPVSSGDFRYYFLDLDEGRPLTVLLEWVEGNSDQEIYVLSNATDWFSENAGGRYGVGTLARVGDAEGGPRTASLAVEMNAGLGLVAVRSTFLAGVAAEERHAARVGTVRVTPSPWVVEGLPVNGSRAFAIESELDLTGLSSTVQGGERLLWTNQSVDPYPWMGEPFRDYLFNAPNTLRTEVPEDAQEATWSLSFHSGARDVDMGLFFDGDCDGDYTAGSEQTGGAASTLENPEVFTLIDPTPGCYWVHAAGFDVDPGSLYDLTLDLILEPFVTVTSLPEDLEAGVPIEVTVDWALPHEPKTFIGTLSIGNATWSEAIVVPFTLTPDLPPEFSGWTPLPGSVGNDPTPTVAVQMEDAADAYVTAVDPDSVEVWLDGARLTSLATVTDASVTLAVPWGLEDGTHTVRVRATDLAGSTNETVWAFVVDTTAPSLVIALPAERLTNLAEVTVAGETDPGASVTVDGTPVPVDAAGAFSTALSLSEGTHALPVVAIDAAGNVASVTLDLVVDRTPPSLTLESPVDGLETPVATVRVQGDTEGGASVTVNGVAVPVETDGSFSLDLALRQGPNEVEVVATDAAGNAATERVTVVYNDPVPALRGDLEGLRVLLFVVTGVLVAVAAVAVLLFTLYWMERTGREPPRFLRFGRK